MPVARFIVGDVREVLPNLSTIDVLFYRRDSDGEGGSDVFVLGDSILPLILNRFPSAGGLIISDGSNSRGGNFRKMKRQSGLRKHGWNFVRLTDQPLADTHGLWVTSVTPASGASPS